ncbi:MAG TPA: TRZ/ATZ family hydrolase [Burkholderiales bacterium]|nr:TRZ/ATZ family hydrolase [Burkholderiales bacterium]
MQTVEKPSSVDLILEPRWIIPVEPHGVVLSDHAIAVSGGNIVALLPSNIMRERYSARETLTLAEHVLIPGLVNLHTHAAMTLMRGLADDLALMDWLENHIWPTEGRHVSPQFVYDGTLLACAEMLRGGVTCFNDMYFFPEMAARAALQAGMRAALGIILIEFPTAYASDAQDYLRKGLATRDELKGEPLLSFCMAPHAPYTVHDKSFERIGTFAEQLQVPIHMHLHETRHEVEESVKQHGVRPLERLSKLGLLGPGLIAVHSVHLEPSEIALLAEHGCSVAHCPASNLKLASGFAPVGKLLDAGVNVGIGTDGAASNNRLDILSELRLAALIAKADSGDPRTLSAHAALRMATLAGARALGLESSIGSIEPGKSADLVAVNLSALEVSPCYDPASHLTYVAERRHVSRVWVRGELLCEDGRLKHMDEKDLVAKARQWHDRILLQQ